MHISFNVFLISSSTHTHTHTHTCAQVQTVHLLAGKKQLPAECTWSLRRSPAHLQCSSVSTMAKSDLCKAHTKLMLRTHSNTRVKVLSIGTDRELKNKREAAVASVKTENELKKIFHYNHQCHHHHDFSGSTFNHRHHCSCITISTNSITVILRHLKFISRWGTWREALDKCSLL